MENQFSQHKNQDIIQSPNDKRIYKYIKLKNGMECLLIQDTTTTKSAASLDVAIGSLHEPQNISGLAHFLEHMLFLGSEKYPQVNEFDQQLAQNSGTNNAETDDLDTAYSFECSNQVFENMLEIFAEFFISPKFYDQFVDKELNAIDQEYQMNLNDDECRVQQLFQSFTREGHPFKKCPFGNKKSLLIPNIRTSLIKFYEEVYSSHLMKLVVYSNQSVEAQEKIVEKMFSPIKQKQVELPKIPVDPYKQENMGQFVKILPIKDEDSLEIFWILPSLLTKYKSQLTQYFCTLFGHEGENSLLSYLIDEGYATELESYSIDTIKQFTQFGFRIVLTDNGFQNYESVLKIVFKYIQVLKKKGVQKWFFDEIKSVKEIEFSNKENEETFDYVTKLAKELQQYPVKDLLAYKYQWEIYDEKGLQEIICSLTIENMFIFLSSQTFENCSEFITEQNFGVKYKSQKIPKSIIQAFSDPQYQNKYTKKILDLPVKNIFIPHNFKLVEEKPKQFPSYPNLIYNTPNSRVWLYNQSRFQVSKGFVALQIYTTDCSYGKTPLAFLQSQLWIEIFQFYISEISYLALEASSELKLQNRFNHVLLTIEGFSDSIYQYIEQIFDKLKSFDIKKIGSRIFDIYYEKVEEDLYNFFKEPPSSIVKHLQTLILID